MKIKLGDICHKETSGYAQKDLETLNGEYPIYGASGYIKCIDSYHQENPYVAVVKDGAGVGRTMYLPGKSSVIGTLQYLISEEKIDPHYLYYLVKAKHLEKYYMGAAIPHIYYKDYKNEKIPDYDLKKQLKIVSRLSRIEKIIDYKKLQIEQLDNLIKARFVEMFGDPKYNADNCVKIKEIGMLTSGGTPSRTNPEYFEGDIRWYSAGELNSLYLQDSIEHISIKAIQQSSAKIFEAGTLLIGMYDTAAFKMGILTEKSSSNQACANLKPNEGYNVIWLYYLFELKKSVFLQERQGVRQKNLSLSKIREFRVPVASFKLQNQFADFVIKINKSKFG